MNALILVDLQNDFLPGGALAVPRGDEVIAAANRLQPHFPLIVATLDWHPPDHGSFASNHPGRRVGDRVELDGVPQVLWPDHCVRDSHGARLAPSLHTLSIARAFCKGVDPRVDSYSAFRDNGRRTDTGLGDYLRDRGVTDLFVLGLATEYCVRATALDAAAYGFATWLFEDGCRGVESRPGDVAAALAEMERAGVRRIASKTWLSERDRGADRSTLASGRYLRLMRSGRWEYAERSNATGVVVIVPTTVDDAFVLIEQYREPLGRRCIEFPAGLVGDAPGDEHEELITAVRRELMEETGFAAADVKLLGEAVPSAGLTSERVAVFRATGLCRVAAGGGADGELIQVHLVARGALREWLDRRRAEGIEIAMSLYGGLWLAERETR